MPSTPPSVTEGKIVNLARLILAASVLAKDLEFPSVQEYLGRELEYVHEILASQREDFGTHIDYTPQEG